MRLPYPWGWGSNLLTPRASFIDFGTPPPLILPGATISLESRKESVQALTQ